MSPLKLRVKARDESQLSEFIEWRASRVQTEALSTDGMDKPTENLTGKPRLAKAT